MKIIDNMPKAFDFMNELEMNVVNTIDVSCVHCGRAVRFPETIISQACDDELRQVISHLYGVIEQFDRLSEKYFGEGVNQFMMSMEMKELMEKMKKPQLKIIK